MFRTILDIQLWLVFPSSTGGTVPALAGIPSAYEIICCQKLWMKNLTFDSPIFVCEWQFDFLTVLPYMQELSKSI